MIEYVTVPASGSVAWTVTTAVVSKMLGLTFDETVNAISNAWIDGQSLRAYRHSPQAGSRKSWAAGDAASRGVRLALHPSAQPRLATALPGVEPRRRRHAEEPPLDKVGISAFGGLGDEEISREDVEAWKEHTRGRFRIRMLPGDHFFINSTRDLILESVARDLAELHVTAPGSR